MAAVSAEDDRTTEGHSQDRVQRALQVAVVAGFMGNSQRVQETCLGLCNACREGVPLGCLRIVEDVPPTVLAMVLPDARQAPQADTPLTRVLQHRRVLKVKWIFSDMFEDKLSELQWPEGVKEMNLFRFNRAVNDVAWPMGLDRLSFGTLGSTYFPQRSAIVWNRFNCSLQGVIFPSGLREIFLGEAFNQPIEDILWPQGLERMSLPGYDHPIDNVKWPPALKSLEFLSPEEIKLRQDPYTYYEDLSVDEDGFNKPFTKLPASLETLWLSYGFAQRSLEGIAWPTGLATIGFGEDFCSHLTTGISWPSSLRNIYSFHEIDAPPEGCVVTLVKDYDYLSDRENEPDYLSEFPYYSDY